VSRRIPRVLRLAAALAWLGGCSGEPTDPIGATLDVRYSTTADDDGAVLLTVSGGPVDSVEAPGYALYSARVDANTLRIIVVGDLSSGSLVRIHIADDRLISQYSAVIDQVAARGSYAQRDPASYALSLTP
jgi:hypothetical protein